MLVKPAKNNIPVLFEQINACREKKDRHKKDPKYYVCRITVQSIWGLYNAYQGLCHKVNQGLTTASEN